LRIQILRGPALSGKTERLMAAMAEAHREDPTSYTFIAPSPEEAASFAERFSRAVKGPIPAGNFVSPSRRSPKTSIGSPTPARCSSAGAW